MTYLSGISKRSPYSGLADDLMYILNFQLLNYVHAFQSNKHVQLHKVLYIKLPKHNMNNMSISKSNNNQIKNFL